MTSTTTEHEHPKPSTFKEYLRYVLTGFAMGSADIVPGVSGGTMALIFGIYEDLIEAIKSVGFEQIRLAVTFRIKKLLDSMPWQFLVALFAGIGLAVLTMSQVLSYLLDTQPVFVFAFFFGLILASIIAVGATLEKWGIGPVIALIAGAAAAWLIVGLVPVNAPNDYLTLFLSGSVAIIAMILPGISGAFILLILGQYEYVLNAVVEFNVVPLIFVAVGCVVGLALFSRVLSWLLKRYHSIVIATLVGFMAGSLRKIWPWREATAFGIDRHGAEFALSERLLWPDIATPEFALALGLMVIGFVLVCILDHQKDKSNPVVLLVLRLFGKAPVTAAETES